MRDPIIAQAQAKRKSLKNQHPQRMERQLSVFSIQGSGKVEFVAPCPLKVMSVGVFNSLDKTFQISVSTISEPFTLAIGENFQTLHLQILAGQKIRIHWTEEVELTFLLLVEIA